MIFLSIKSWFVLVCKIYFFYLQKSLVFIELWIIYLISVKIPQLCPDVCVKLLVELLHRNNLTSYISKQNVTKVKTKTTNTGLQRPILWSLLFGFVIFINQMFGSYQTSVIQKLLKDANFLSVYVFVYNNYVCDMCLHDLYSRCAKTWPSSYGFFETENKWCGSCILMTKLLTQTNHYDIGTLNFGGPFAS